MISRRRSSAVAAAASRDSTWVLSVRVCSVCVVVSAPSRRSLRDLFGELVALGLQRFDLRDGLATFAVDCGEIAEHHCGVHAPRAQFFFYKGQVGPYKR